MTIINESFEDLEEWPWPRAIDFDGPTLQAHSTEHRSPLDGACWFNDPLACPMCRELCGIDPVSKERAEHLAKWNVVGQSPEGCLHVEPKGGWAALRSEAAIIYDSGPIECEYTHDHTGRLTILTAGGVTHPDFEG